MCWCPALAVLWGTVLGVVAVLCSADASTRHTVPQPPCAGWLHALMCLQAEEVLLWSRTPNSSSEALTRAHSLQVWPLELLGAPFCWRRCSSALTGGFVVGKEAPCSELHPFRKQLFKFQLITAVSFPSLCSANQRGVLENVRFIKEKG